MEIGVKIHPVSYTISRRSTIVSKLRDEVMTMMALVTDLVKVCPP